MPGPLLTSSNTIRQDVYCIEIFTDATLEGWSAMCKNQIAQGLWHRHEKIEHIHYLELKAAFYGLQTLLVIYIAVTFY